MTRIRLSKSRKIDLALLLVFVSLLAIAGFWARHKAAQNYADGTITSFGSSLNAGAHAVDQWIADLAGTDPTVRLRAAESLAAVGSPSIQPLCKALAHEDPLVRRYAAIALRKIGPRASEAIPALNDRLKDEDEQVMRESLAALGQMDFEGEQSVSSIAEVVDHPNESLRFAAIETLGRMGELAKPALQEKLQVVEPATRVRIAIELSRLTNPTEEVAKVLCERLAEFHEADPQQQALVFNEISAAICRVNRIAVPLLIEALNSENGMVRQRAVTVLAGMGPDAKEAVPALIKTLKDDYVASIAASALGRIGPDARTAIPHLIDAMKSGNWGATTALVTLGPDSELVLECFINALKSENGGVRFNGAKGLGLLGTNAKRSAPALRAAARDNDKDPQLRLYVAQALWKVDQDTDLALPLLMQALEEPLFGGAPSLIEEVATTLGEMGPRATGAVPVLMRLIKGRRDRSGVTPPAVYEALKKINGGAEAKLGK